MGFVVPVGIREPFEKLPQGMLRFKIEGGQEGNVGTEEDQCFGIEIMMATDSPMEAAGIPHNARFYLGLREGDWAVKQGKAKADPMAGADDTLLITMGRFKAFCAAAGVEIEGKNTDLIYSELKDRYIIGKVEHKVSKDNPDQTNARVTRWLPDGTVEPHISEVEVVAAASAKAGVKAAPTPGPRPNGGAQVAAPAPAPAPQAIPGRAARPTPGRLTARG